MAATIVYSPESVDHLAVLTKQEQTTIIDQVQQLLTHEPTLPSRKRKFLRPNALAQWELRLGDLRVFYDVTIEEVSDGDTKHESTTMTIKAVGKKEHNQLRIGGKRIDL